MISEKRILVLNFFPARYPPTTGGELRYFHFYNELSKYYDVTLLSSTHPQPSIQIKEHSKTFKEYLVPHEIEVHGDVNRKLKGKVGIEYSALVSAISSYIPNKHHEVFLELYESSDIIIHDSPFMLGYDIFLGMDNKPRIYNSYNHEASLAEQMWDGVDAAKYVNYFREIENKLVNKADLVFAVSDMDKSSFINSYMVNENKIKLAPNGIVPEEWLTNIKQKEIIDRPIVLFIGSKHPPNYKAVDFIVNNLADQCKNINFIIAGECCKQFDHIKKSNVKLLGIVDTQEKKRLFNIADLAINPMFSGGGTNLKVLEFLTAGIPLISTPMGVRGLGLINNKHFVSAEEENFAAKLNDLVQNNTLRKKLSTDGKSYVDRNYSWKDIVKNFKHELMKIQKDKKRTLFILNDFKISNPTSGGEVRIKELYSKFSKDYTINLLCFSNSNKIEINQVTSNFYELAIPKTNKHSQEIIKLNGRFNTSVNDVVNSYMCKENFFLKKASKILYHLSDFTVLTHPYMIQLVKDLKGKPLIYESLNAEVQLKEKILIGHPKYDFLINQVREVEKLAVDKSDVIITVSETDQDLIKQTYNLPNKIHTVRNGINPMDVKFLEKDFSSVKKVFNDCPVILFIGSQHYPNVDALLVSILFLASNLKNCYFVIIGSVCNGVNRILPSNILLFNVLDEKIKNVLMRISDVAINPITMGSGSNLKIAEYFGNKVPVVTTPFGARGYEITNGKHALICEVEHFPDAIFSLLKDQALKKQIVDNAYNYVKKDLTWEHLALKYQNILERLSANSF